MTELNTESMDMLKKSGLYDIIGANHFFSETSNAINYALDLIDTKKCPYCAKRPDQGCRVFKKVENESIGPEEEI